MYHIFLVPSSTDGRLGYFHTLATVTHAANSELWEEGELVGMTLEQSVVFFMARLLRQPLTDSVHWHLL